MSAAVRQHLEARVRAIELDLAEVRARLAELPDDNGTMAGDLLGLGAAAERFRVAKDTLRKWCRSNDDLGVRRGGRWQVRISELRRHLRQE